MTRFEIFLKKPLPPEVTMYHIEIKKNDETILSRNCEDKDFKMEEKRNITALYNGKLSEHSIDHIVEMVPSAKSQLVIIIDSFQIPENTFFHTRKDPE